MSSKTARQQSFDNHRSWPPIIFVIAGFVLLADTLRHSWLAIDTHDFWHVWACMVDVALLVVGLASRRNAQIVQDRVIRLEMQVRLERVLGATRRADVTRLELAQLVALRFASDAELPQLVGEVLAGKLTKAGEIKRRVKDWQADWLRV